jgi:acyl-CoA thioesterase-1
MSRILGILLSLLVALAPPALRTAHAAANAAGAEPAPPPGRNAVILVFGDSISAGYGIRPEQGWVNLLARRLEQKGYGFHVVNASVSGETTAGGLARLPRALERQRPRLLILELGGNDGLRSLPLSSSRANLAQMIELARKAGVPVLLLGMRLPPNYGERYTSGFQSMFSDLAQQYQLPLVPFLLEHVALDPALMQADGLHPNEQGQPFLLDNVWPKLEPLLRGQGHERTAASR